MGPLSGMFKGLEEGARERSYTADLGRNLKSSGGCLLVTIPRILPVIHPASSINRIFDIIQRFYERRETIHRSHPPLVLSYAKLKAVIEKKVKLREPVIFIRPARTGQHL